MTSSVTFVGDEAAMRELRRWADQVAPAVDKQAKSFAEGVADVVRDRVPHLSGQLADSVEAADADEGVEIEIGGGVPYAGWIEFGGSRGRAYVPDGRYLSPTAQSAIDEYVTLAADAAQDTVGRFNWSTPSA